MKSTGLRAISFQVLLSFVLVCALIISAFFLGLYLHRAIWLIAAWPAQLARVYEGGYVLHYLTTLLFGNVTQGKAHFAELVIIFAVWWPICFIIMRLVLKRHGFIPNS